jgi:hypothetical protein
MKKTNSCSLVLILISTALSVGCAEMRKGPCLIPVGENSEMTVLWQLRQTGTCLLEWGQDARSKYKAAH